MASILWIESRRNNTPAFVPGLRKKGYRINTVPTGKAALARISALHPDLAVVNAASLRTNGQRICRSLKASLNGHPVALITDPSLEFSEEPCADLVLELPFTLRKLLNRIKALVPEETAGVLRAGPLTLYPDDQVVRSNGSEPQRLTPNLTRLLKTLIKHSGEVVEREDLFRQVWKTNYVGDTRTLDVHISWLRKKIEADPGDPQLLKTIRGVGYRLDV